VTRPWRVFAGFRNGPVFIRRSMHVPPSCEAVRELMPAFFELLKSETEAAVRVVLGHFAFVYIHPYMDGNGRMGRFLMNAMMAAGGYSWTIIPVERRTEYMSALESASVFQDIKPFARFLAFGITTAILIQAFFNMSVVLALLPTKGIPLPFISSGGTSIFITLASMGVLLNITREID